MTGGEPLRLQPRTCALRTCAPRTCALSLAARPVLLALATALTSRTLTFPWRGLCCSRGTLLWARTPLPSPLRVRCARHAHTPLAVAPQAPNPNPNPNPPRRRHPNANPSPPLCRHPTTLTLTLCFAGILTLTPMLP